jgi:WD40 repeat protein
MADHYVPIWEVSSGQRKHLLKSDQSIVRYVAFSADSKTIATCNPDNIVKLWHVSTGREMLRFDNLSPGNEGVQFSPDGNYLALIGKSSDHRPGEVELLRAPTFEEIAAAEKLRGNSR